MFTVFLILGLVGVPFFAYKGWSAVHSVTAGPRKAKAAYARLRREQPNSSDVVKSEAEFVDDYMSKRPGVVMGYFYFVLGGISGVLLILGIWWNFLGGDELGDFFKAATGG